jgi:hypothetical protein
VGLAGDDREYGPDVRIIWLGCRSPAQVGEDAVDADKLNRSVDPADVADQRRERGIYVELARATDGPQDELAVGTGRVAIPVAQATGRPVIGIDSAPAMLAQARTRAANAGVHLDLREGDIRDLTLEQPAGLIYCPFRSLVHLPSAAGRRRTFQRVAASLQPGGRFAGDAFAFDHRIACRLDGMHQDPPVPHTIRCSVGENRIDIFLDTGARRSLWWATKNEWLSLIDIAGLEPEDLYGGFALEPLADGSQEYLFITRRPPLDDHREQSSP